MQPRGPHLCRIACSDWSGSLIAQTAAARGGSWAVWMVTVTQRGLHPGRCYLCDGRPFCMLGWVAIVVVYGPNAIVAVPLSGVG